MNRFFCITKRFCGLLFFGFICFAAMLYAMERFDFIFINRDLPISGRGNTVIEAPQMSEDDKEIENQVSQMVVGDNLSGITAPPKKDDDSTEDDKPGESSGTQAVPEEIYYPSFEQALSSGYRIYEGVYGGKAEVILAELLFENGLTLDQVKGMKNVLADAPVIYEDGGERFYAAAETEVYRFSVEIYMGYIIVNDKTTSEVYTSEGTLIGAFGHSELRPAYMRDVEGNPLFMDAEDKYFYFNSSGRMLYSSYRDDIDSIGLYFNYGSDFANSDSKIEIYRTYENVYFIDELDTTDYYILSSVDPDLAYSIYILRPAYAEKVARYNPRFALALSEAKEKIEEEKRLEEERKNEYLTADTEELKSPESETATPDTETNAVAGVNTSTAESADVTDTGVSTEKTEDTEGTSAPAQTETITHPAETEPVTNIENELEGDSSIETDTATESDTDTEMRDTTRAPVTSSDPNILIVERELRLLRYAYGLGGEEDIDSLDYKYAKAYNFSEGRAAVVDDDGILRYINAAGEVVIDGVGTKMVTASRYITTEYAEPLYRHSENSKGYLYFDNGLVRVRKLERDYTFRNLIYSDSDVLLYPDGSEFAIPHGFELIAYSEGILVLKGQNGKFGYYHKDGYWIAQPVYTEIHPFSEGLGVIGFSGGKKGVIDTSGNIVVPFAYEYITAPSGGIMSLYSYEGGWRIFVKMA